MLGKTEAESWVLKTGLFIRDSDRRTAWLAFGLILVLAFLVRIVALDQGLWGDELEVFKIAQRDLVQLINDVMRQETHPPLSYILLHGWFQVGVSETWARGLFVLFGIGTCVVTYGLGQALAGRRFGLLAMAVTALLPSAVWASRYIRSYIVGAFFVGAAAWSFLVLLKGRRSAWSWARYSALSALALHAFYFNGLILASQGLYGLVVGWRWQRWKSPLLLSQGLAVASLFPLVPAALQSVRTAGLENPLSSHYMVLHNVGFYIGGFHLGGLVRSLAGALGGDQLFMAGPLHRSWPYVLLAIVGLTIVFVTGTLFYLSCRWLNENGHDREKLAAGTWVVSMLLVPVLLANTIHHLYPLSLATKYFIPLVPFAACLWAGAVEAMPRRWLTGAVVGLFVIFCGTRLYSIYNYEGANWRGAVPFVEARLQPGDGVVFLQRGFKADYDYYASSPIPQVDLQPFLESAMVSNVSVSLTEVEQEKLKATLGGFQRIWFFVMEPYRFEQDRVVAKWVRSQFRTLEEKRFGLLVLTLLKMNPGQHASSGPAGLKN